MTYPDGRPMKLHSPRRYWMKQATMAYNRARKNEPKASALLPFHDLMMALVASNLALAEELKYTNRLQAYQTDAMSEIAEAVAEYERPATAEELHQRIGYATRPRPEEASPASSG